MKEQKKKAYSTKDELMRKLAKYNRLYYLSIIVNFLALLSAVLQITFVFIIEGGHLLAFISLLISFILIIIAFFIKLILHNSIIELLTLMEREENSKNRLSERLNYIISILTILREKSHDDTSFIQLIKLFDLNQSSEEESKTLEKVVDDNE